MAYIRTQHLEETFDNRLDLVVHQNKRKKADVDNIKCSREVLWQVLVDVPVPERHIGRQCLLGRRGVKRYIKTLQASRGADRLTDIEEPDAGDESLSRPSPQNQDPGTWHLPRARADVCHSQVGAVGGDLGVDVVAKDLGPQGMHQINA